MDEPRTQLLLIDLPDRDLAARLAHAINAAGPTLSAVTRGQALPAEPSLDMPDPAEAARALAEDIRESGADFLLLDPAHWSAISMGDPRLGRSVITIVLLGPDEEGRIPAILKDGAFDCLAGGGAPGELEGRAAAYFTALAALRRRFQAAFTALERRYEDLVHSLPDIVYELDEEGRFTFINNSVRLLGYEPADLSGKHFSVILNEEDAKAVDRDEILELFQGAATGPALAPKLFNERRAFDRRTENLEVRLKRNPEAPKGGDLLGSVIAYGEVTAAGEYARRGEGQSFVGSVGVIRDITLRRRAEQMLRELYQAVDQLSAGVLIVDREFHVEYVNPAFLRLSRREPPEVVGKELASFFSIDSRRLSELRDLVREGFDFRAELALEVSGAVSVWTAFHISPVKTPAGDVTHAIAVCEDVSQRRAMEELLRVAKEEAERANRAKSDFLASMGHELKSPVASILSAARLVEMGDPDPARRASSIIRSAEGLLSVLADILDYVRFEAGTATLRRFAFPLVSFLSRTCEPFRQAASAKGLGFELAQPPEELVTSDPDRLGRAVAALLDNAVAFSDKGGVRVESAVERRDGNIPYLVVSVHDTGRGIAVADQGRIFDPFVQLASPFSKRGGTGIGLSLSRNIVRALGGEIRLESEPERGSVFTILVPVGEPETDAAAAATRRASVRGTAAQEGVQHFLVVDDNEVNLDFMAAILRNAGHRVDIAASGAAALAVLEEREHDAAILDIQMPGMSGIELGKRIRGYAGDRYDASLPLIALTAFDAEEVLRSGVDFDGVFAKPVDVGKLLALSRQAIEARAVEAAGAFGKRWGARPGTGAVLLTRAERDVPGLFARIDASIEAGERDAFHNAAQLLGVHFTSLGAEKAEAALRRLALAIGGEEAPILASRARRLRLVWQAFCADARASLRGSEGIEGGKGAGNVQ